VELGPMHGFHGGSVLCEQLRDAGYPMHPQDKILKGNYKGLYTACTGVTIPAASGGSASPLVLDELPPLRFETLLKKEADSFTAQRRRDEVELEACGLEVPIDCIEADGSVPLQYQTGLALFCGRRYMVTPDVLIPRPCYETIVEAALKRLRPSGNIGTAVDHGAAVLDLGCGSGCLFLACLAELPHLSGVGLDLCPKAIRVAVSNAERFGLSDRCKWMQSDFNNLSEAFDPRSETFDAILFNPPYLERSSWLSATCLAEPELALFVESKYDAYRQVESGLRQCRRMETPLLRQGGFLVIGLGSGHLETVITMYEAHGEFLCEEVLVDLMGTKRSVVFRAL